jgi:hypothetical protein
MRARRSRRDHRIPGAWHKRQKGRFSGAPCHYFEGGRMNSNGDIAVAFFCAAVAVVAVVLAVYETFNRIGAL